MSDIDPIEDEVLLAYAVEPEHDLATLERYLRRYPQFAQGLIDCSIELKKAPDPVALSAQGATPAAAAAAWECFEKAMAGTPPTTSNPFSSVDSQAFRMLAAELNMNVLLLMRLRDRAIKAATVPRRLVQMLADKLNIGLDLMDDYLRSPPALAAGGVQFKSAAKPAVAPQVDFGEAVRTSQLSDEQQKLLLALVD